MKHNNVTCKFLKAVLLTTFAAIFAVFSAGCSSGSVADGASPDSIISSAFFRGLDNYRQFFKHYAPWLFPDSSFANSPTRSAYASSEAGLGSTQGSLSTAYIQSFASSEEPASSMASIDAASPSHRVFADEFSLYSYFIPELSSDEADNFAALYEGIMAFEDEIELPHMCSSQEVSDLMHLLTNDCPELFHISSQWTEHSNLIGYVLSVSPEYTIDKAEFENQTASVTLLIDDFHRLLDGQNDYNIELYIYDFIINSCVYSTEAFNCQNAYGALCAGYAKCDGRAKAMVYALRSFGIKSSVMTGNAHAWVVANIDGYDYNADPTYDDNESNGTQQPTAYAYFNIPESAIASDPYPADDFYQRRGYPATVRWDANYHVRSDMWVASGDSAYATAQSLFTSQIESLFQSRSDRPIMLRFEDAKDYASAMDSYSGWIQTFINAHSSGCNIVNYDYSRQQLLTLLITFK